MEQFKEELTQIMTGVSFDGDGYLRLLEDAIGEETGAQAVSNTESVFSAKIQELQSTQVLMNLSCSMKGLLDLEAILRSLYFQSIEFCLRVLKDSSNITNEPFLLGLNESKESLSLTDKPQKRAMKNPPGNDAETNKENSFLSQNNVSSSLSCLNDSGKIKEKKPSLTPTLGSIYRKPSWLERTSHWSQKSRSNLYSTSKMISKKPKKYNMMAADAKMDVIRDAEELGIAEASRKHGVKSKNIKRWMKNGVVRKPGGGRKTQDPQMERKLLAWIKDYLNENEGIFPSRKLITHQAKMFSDYPKQFKASKGWLDKFIKRKQLTGYTPSESAGPSNPHGSQGSNNQNSESIFQESDDEKPRSPLKSDKIICPLA